MTGRAWGAFGASLMPPGMGAMDSALPKVCVGIMAFNQAGFIRQALDGALAQETDFPFDILVHDDCSGDGTREIVEDYVAKFPGRVRAILQSENQYSQGRRILPIVLAEMRGQYFALLDGDDFWQSNHKLQAQVDFLDANPGCVTCQTKTVYFNESEKRTEMIFPPKNRRRMRHDIADLAEGNFLQTSAVMFRADALPEFPTAYENLAFGDYAFFALLAQAGWIGLVDEEMATYRIHGANFWVGTPEGARIAATEKVIRFLAENLRPEFRQPWIEAAKATSSNALLRPFVWLRRRLGLAPVMPRLRRALGLSRR